ncbi:hypothetical protein AN7064.2 [Aspergillus nidulans FGSC A4]|uniref:Fumarylacetoacetate hydrolase family protein (AFU_orthologue AFUA_7G07000) n=1 Tax=Emericella nidulans (strain FGSC A4 / ATCC 38163 / CBS 112.46 / NRRL 194 / M139) TaxID=227321 RepID=Q5AXB6_EMENI|nr:hypothetical protein [Aspergillus nidulans FGSC A4]EAA61193.1 hypothetical protein AN7064.2 [Aspergillus nidulans FGSC A4]CBF79160.1 TPA: fumarylacetoacetate hydrolase family protein (AFU_orthologue; AFUA_7G07000) [Aspergillus nidulans FGSC A4]|eukprot:XP_664668.1 hypothetical protein AN7064.2 [Aspergillus nidulans FGSC A4]
MAPWESLIRFKATDKNIYWAQLSLEQTPSAGLTLRGFPTIEALEADEQSTHVTVEEASISLFSGMMPIVTGPAPRSSSGNWDQYHLRWSQLPQPRQRGIGEIKTILFKVPRLISPSYQLAIPQCPPMWYKAPPALANPDSDIPFPVQAQNAFPDFEGELTIVLRNTIKSVPAASSTSHILGYTIGNDLTARMFQRACGGQYTHAKGYDNFAPLGPRLVHPSVFEPSNPASRITTRVNGRVVQDSPFDFIFPIDELLAFLSEGTTIPAGTAIMTGTPAGVGWFQDPKRSLADGDVVGVEVKPIGVLRNRIVFEK